ncbi:MAG: hypothetical protein JXL97_19270 [Bacteroidales bacterium]|nr:hypothetical protein [Bacteroidales bacterium]
MGIRLVTQFSRPNFSNSSIFSLIHFQSSTEPSNVISGIPQPVQSVAEKYLLTVSNKVTSYAAFSFISVVEKSATIKLYKLSFKLFFKLSVNVVKTSVQGLFCPFLKSC